MQRIISPPERPPGCLLVGMGEHHETAFLKTAHHCSLSLLPACSSLMPAAGTETERRRSCQEEERSACSSQPSLPRRVEGRGMSRETNKPREGGEGAMRAMRAQCLSHGCPIGGCRWWFIEGVSWSSGRVLRVLHGAVVGRRVGSTASPSVSLSEVVAGRSKNLREEPPCCGASPRQKAVWGEVLCGKKVSLFLLHCSEGYKGEVQGQRGQAKSVECVQSQKGKKQSKRPQFQYREACRKRDY